MGKYFGTDGFRGEANVMLTADHAYRIGRYLGLERGKKKRILVGKDTRLSCDMFENALVGGLLASGAEVFLLGVVTTPAVSHLVRTCGFDLGVMISASHNPFFDNGIKLFDRNGEKEEAILPSLEAYLDGNENLPFATGKSIGAVHHAENLQTVYLESLRFLKKDCCRGYRIGLDLANGGAFRLARAAFEYLGAEIFAICDEPDGENINRDGGSTHTEALEKLVKEKKLDIGFAFDGDGDRCIAVDGNGDVVDGDQLLYLFACYLQKKDALRGHTVVTTVMSNLGLYQALDRLKITYQKTSVGDKYVWECMKNGGFSLGGEQSGHLIFSDHAVTGDGILTAIMVMSVLLEEKQTLVSLLAPMTRYPQTLENVRVNDAKLALNDIEVKDVIHRVEKRLGDEGCVMVRASGTEPVVRVMIQANDLALCRSCAAEIKDVILSRFTQ